MFDASTWRTDTERVWIATARRMGKTRRAIPTTRVTRVRIGHRI
jgi:hypothetical protein